MAKHAVLSPSSAERWMTCPGSVVLSEGYPNTSSSYADEGTAAHFLAAHCLETSTSPLTYINRTIALYKDAEGETQECFEMDLPAVSNVLSRHIVDDDFAFYVQDYTAYVRSVRDATCGKLLVEQRMSLEGITGEEDAEGTSDAVILADDEIIVTDLKFGQGVSVDADDNPQLKMYALSAVDKFGLLHDFSQARLVINQPRTKHVSEVTYTITELEDFRKEVATAVVKVEQAKIYFTKLGETAWQDAYLNASSEKACRWCKAKANCPAAAKVVSDAIEQEFEDLRQEADVPSLDPVHPIKFYSTEELSAKMRAIDYIEAWMKAVRAEVERLLLAGTPVDGYKIVQGKMGHRKWGDADEVEKVFKSMRLKEAEMYDFSLISPTTAEKRLKDSPKRWNRVKPLITQSQGGPSVAPASDKRPALIITPVEDDMTDLRVGMDLL